MRSYLIAFIFCLATNFAFTEEESWILFDETITFNLNVNTCQSIDGRIVYPVEESNYHEIFGERK